MFSRGLVIPLFWVAGLFFLPSVQAQQAATLSEQPSSASINSLRSSGRYLGVKTNIAAWAGTIMNIAADVQVSEHLSVELPILWCPWHIGSKHAVKTFTIQPEARYWLSKPGKGHFFGVHAHVGWFNVKWNRDRYQDTDGPLLGAGISYGYLLPFNEHSAGEFTLGAGYANMRYDTFYNMDNGARIDTRTKNYWGITLTQNSYDAGTPANICIGHCIFNNGGNITIDKHPSYTR